MHAWGICTLGESNVKMDIEVIGREGVDWIYLAEDGEN